MGALGGIINQAMKSATSRKGTTLQDFMSHFSSSEGIWIKQIDPIATFDLSFKFYPSKWDSEQNDKGWLEKMGSVGMKSAKNALNNVTGGLLGSLMNSKFSIKDKHDSFKTEANKYGTESHTFMEYLAAANLLVGKDDWIGESAGESITPLELQLGLYCQEITIPAIEVYGSQTSQGVIGEFPINGLFVKPDSTMVQMKMINTKVPLFERIFYPWMRECTLCYWSYEKQPYTTATITVDLTKHNDVKYVFVGCRPCKLEMQQPNQQATQGNLTRNVSFLFDYMFITSSLNNCENLSDKLITTAQTLVNSAAKMINA